MFKNTDLLNESVSDFKEAVWDPCASIPVYQELETDFDPIIIDELIKEARRIQEILGTEIPPDIYEKELKIYGWEVGDDRLDISNNPLSALVTFAAQEMISRFETSWKDTGISKYVWNFCEVTSHIPSTTLGDIRRAKKSGFDDVDYVDTPPLRIVSDVSKAKPEATDHSSSNTGKSEMLGSRTKSSKTSLRSIMEISSYLQDGILSSCDSPDPKYLPGIMGGSNSPPLFENWKNVYTYLCCYKGGTYTRVYGSAINELYDCVRYLDDYVPAQPAICAFLRKRQDLLHITYGPNVVMPTIATNQLDGEEVKPLYKAVGGFPFLQGAENRLVQAGLLATKRQADRELEIRRGIRELLFSDLRVTDQRSLRKLERVKLSAEFDGTIRANSAYQRMLAGTANDADLVQTYLDGNLIAGSGRTSLNIHAVEWIAKGGNGEVFNIFDLTHSEDMYVLEEVSESRTLRVKGIQITPLFNRMPIVTKETRSEIGKWQITETKLEWGKRILQQLTDLRAQGKTLYHQDVFPIMAQNPEWVNDDTLIVRRLIEELKEQPKQTVLLVTADKRLARNAAKTTGFPIATVDPQSVTVNVTGKEFNAEMVLTPSEVLMADEGKKNLLIGHPPVYKHVFIDTGSLEAYAQRVVVQPNGRNYYRRLLRHGWKPDGTRYEVQTMQLLDRKLVPKVKVYYPNESVHSATTVNRGEANEKETLAQRATRGLRRFMKS
jgi:hypothetical protein